MSHEMSGLLLGIFRPLRPEGANDEATAKFARMSRASAITSAAPIRTFRGSRSDLLPTFRRALARFWGGRLGKCTRQNGRVARLRDVATVGDCHFGTPGSASS